jgi:hypothetical protein
VGCSVATASLTWVAVRTSMTTHKGRFVIMTLVVLGLAGCKNKGKKGESEEPEDPTKTADGKHEGYGKAGSADPGESVGEGDPDGPGRNRNARDLKYLTVDGERCDRTNKREHQVDVNQDGFADLVTLYASETTGDVIACKQADLNFDGRLDAFIHYTAQGDVSREQYDTDFDGRIDMGRYYELGKLMRDEIDLNQDGFADSWRVYDDGRLVRVETDRDADGRADMFTYYAGKQIDRIGYDVNGDGKVDTWDHDAARRARLALQKRQGSEEQKPDEEVYVDEGKDAKDGGKDGGKDGSKDKKDGGKDAKDGGKDKKDGGKDGKASAQKPKSKADDSK